MTDAFLESFLYRTESETLDFKEGQYAFARATPEQKSELLKDILAFANAWRDTDAYILIGIREVKGAKSIVTGIAATDHFDDHSLQQFVSSKTNRPVSFSYQPFASGGLQIGVLALPATDQRPFFLNSDFGLLKKNVVYIRRGSSTAEATPDEVISMAAKAASRPQPYLTLEFCDGETRDRKGQAIEIHPGILNLPDSHAFPIYGRPASYSMSGFSMPSGSMDNNDYYVEMAEYLKVRNRFPPVYLAVSNSSEELADSVVITMRLESIPNVEARDEDGFPDHPSRHNFSMKALHPALARSTHVSLYGLRYEIKVDMGNIQPGQIAYSAQPFYLCSTSEAEVVVEATISANNLRSPITVPLTVALRPRVVRGSIDQIVQFADSRD
jgi:hypothetical protein